MSPEVRAFLTRSGVVFAVHEHVPVVSFEEGRALLPFDPQAMVKSLVFQLPEGRLVIAALRAADRADYKAIADGLGVRRADLRLATAGEVAAGLGMEPGGITPLPLGGALVLADQAVAAMGTIYCGSGVRTATLEIAAADLLRVGGARLAVLAKPG